MEFVAEAPAINLPHIRGWVIGSDPALKNGVIDEIIRFLSQHFRLGPSVMFKYRLCLDEAISNAITHGCKGLDNGEVTIDFHFTRAGWAVRIADPGPGFAENEVPDPHAPGSEMREHGRGIQILARYTDRLCFADGGRVQMFWMRTEDLG